MHGNISDVSTAAGKTIRDMFFDKMQVAVLISFTDNTYLCLDLCYNGASDYELEYYRFRSEVTFHLIDRWDVKSLIRAGIITEEALQTYSEKRETENDRRKVRVEASERAMLAELKAKYA